MCARVLRDCGGGGAACWARIGKSIDRLPECLSAIYFFSHGWCSVRPTSVELSWSCGESEANNSEIILDQRVDWRWSTEGDVYVRHAKKGVGFCFG